MSDPGSLDEINRRLAEIQAELWDLDVDEFTARHALHLERDRLRDQVRTSVDLDADRPTEDLLAELEARSDSLAQIQESMVNPAGMSGGGGHGTGSYEGPADGVKLNTEILAATGAAKLRERIARLETILTERGALPR